MIDDTHDLPIRRQAELLEVSRSNVYYLPRPASEADLAVMRRIDELHLNYPFAGARMLHSARGRPIRHTSIQLQQSWQHELR
jgi:putative transposase